MDTRRANDAGVSDERATVSLYDRSRDTRIATAIRAVIRGVCFWTAITLPLLYVPLLIAGIETRSEHVVLCGLLVLNAVSLVAGHSYDE